MVPSASDNAIFAVDVEGFGDRRRTDPVLVAVREAVHRVVTTAFARAGVPWDRCYHEGCGDGLFVVIPSDVPKRLLSAALPRELAAALREHNDTCQKHAHIRLRAALHAGQVRRDAHGVAGAAVNLTFRLLGARALRSALAQSSGVLALIASDHFFDDVIRHDAASDPSTYRKVRVRVKETDQHAWLSRPDNPYPPARSRRRRLVHAAVAGVAFAGIVITTTASGILAPRPQPPDIAGPVVTEEYPTSEPPGETSNPPSTSGRPGPTKNSPTTQAPAPETSPTPRPSTTQTTPVETSPNTPLTPFDFDDAAVQEERAVTLSNEPKQESIEMDWLRQNRNRTGDLQVDPTGVFTTLGAQLAVIEDSPEPTRDRCEQVRTWTTRVDFAQLDVGSQLCARTAGGRYTMIQVRALPDSPASNGRFVFYARTWQL